MLALPLRHVDRDATVHHEPDALLEAMRSLGVALLCPHGGGVARREGVLWASVPHVSHQALTNSAASCGTMALPLPLRMRRRARPMLRRLPTIPGIP